MELMRTKKFNNLLSFQSETGASMLEYALLAALISVSAIAAVSRAGKENCLTFQIVKCAHESHSFAPQWNTYTHCITHHGNTIKEACE